MMEVISNVAVDFAFDDNIYFNFSWTSRTYNKHDNKI